MLWFLILESSCVAAMAAGYFAARKRRAAAAAGIVILTLALAAKAWLHWNPAAEAALFPWRDCVYLQGYWLFLIASGFCGLAASYLSTGPGKGKRNALIAFGVFLVLLGGYRHSWMAFPQNHGEEIFAGENHHIRQSTAYTCAPCACVSAASYFGVRASEKEMAVRCLTNRTGTNVFNVYRGLVL